MAALVKGVFDLLRDRSVAAVVKETTATRWSSEFVGGSQWDKINYDGMVAEQTNLISRFNRQTENLQLVFTSLERVKTL